MASKTVAQLEQENREMKAKLQALQTQGDLTKENEELKQELETAKSHNAESEARLLEQIKNLQEVQVVGGKVQGTPILVMTPDEYAEWGKKSGTYMGRKIGQKTQCKVEELRVLINSKWRPSQVMEKHGIDAEDLKQLVWKLSKAELRSVPIKYDIKTDQFL